MIPHFAALDNNERIMALYHLISSGGAAVAQPSEPHDVSGLMAVIAQQEMTLRQQEARLASVEHFIELVKHGANRGVAA